MYVVDNELALHSYEDAVAVVKVLLDNGYVTMISREEKLYIVNYVWSPMGANRNDIAFMSREKLEDIIFDTESEN